MSLVRPCMLQAGLISRRHLVSACLVGPVSVLYITNPHFWQKPPAAFAGGGKGLARPALAKTKAKKTKPRSAVRALLRTGRNRNPAGSALIFFPAFSLHLT